MPTPMSGLSLIIHLTVIALGTFFALFRRKKPVNQSTLTAASPKRDTSKFYSATRSVTSISIVVILTTLMLTAFGIALRTSIREGAHEWQRQLVMKTLENLGPTFGPSIRRFVLQANPPTDSEINGLLAHSAIKVFVIGSNHTYDGN